MTWTRGRVLHITDKYAFAADFGHPWTAVEGLRLDQEDVERVVAEVAELVAQTTAHRCNWWLTERSTPDVLEERLLAAGVARHDEDYLHAAMLLTREPPRVGGVVVRRVETFEEFAELDGSHETRSATSICPTTRSRPSGTTTSTPRMPRG